MGKQLLSDDDRRLLRNVQSASAAGLRGVLTEWVQVVGYRAVKHVLNKGRMDAARLEREHKIQSFRAAGDKRRIDQAKELLVALEEA